MADNKISYPVQGSPIRAIQVPVLFTWNATTVTASTQKGNTRKVASIAYTTTGNATITFRENMGALLAATVSCQTTDSSTPGVLPGIGAYSATGKTLVITSLSSALALANSGKAVLFHVNLIFSASARDA